MHEEHNHPYKEVYFYKYCNDCRYEKLSQTEEPCNECLSAPVKLYSHIPVKFEEKKKGK